MKWCVVESFPTAAAKITPETRKFDIDDEDEVVSDFEELASPYIKTYLHKARFLDNNTVFEGRTTVGL